jgi:hypothetical protein
VLRKFKQSEYEIFSGSWLRASAIITVNKIQQDAPVLKSFLKTLLFSPILFYMFRALLCPSSGASILPAFAASGLPCVAALVVFSAMSFRKGHS